MAEQEDEFVQRVFKKLPVLAAEYKEQNEHLIRQRFQKGWSFEDVIAWERCTEEVNPDLDEEVALNRMAVIEKKYEKVT